MMQKQNILKAKVEFKYHVLTIRHTTLILYLLSFSATRKGEEDMNINSVEIIVRLVLKNFLTFNNANLKRY